MDTVRTVAGVVSMRSKVVRRKGVRGIAGWKGCFWTECEGCRCDTRERVRGKKHGRSIGCEK